MQDRSEEKMKAVDAFYDRQRLRQQEEEDFFFLAEDMKDEGEDYGEADLKANLISITKVGQNYYDAGYYADVLRLYARLLKAIFSHFGADNALTEKFKVLAEIMQLIMNESSGSRVER